MKSRDVNLIIVKNGSLLYKSRDPGIAGFLRAIDELGADLHSSTVADKIVGRAVAMLCLYCKIKYVYAVSMTEGAHQLLTERHVPHISETYIGKLMNRQGTGLCPFEMAIKGVNDPDEAYKILKKYSIEIKMKTSNPTQTEPSILE
ncbi:DUF1893 domain-containing protein [Candidatus Bathyarchaeota archaeon]|nr:DUF1893 domain-containing protein [Candidatus Bathyarchaeota archaeon]